MNLVLVRHGESVWNRENRFTGWTDVELSQRGAEEARNAGRILRDGRFDFDICYTSYLKRAIHTLDLLLDEMERQWLPVIKSWKLNERHYGALQGLNKKEYGLESEFNVDEKIEYIMSANRLYDTVMSDGNYQFFHRTVGWNDRRLAELYLLKKDRKEALRYLQLAEREAGAYDGLEDFHYTALLVNRMEYEKEDYFKSWEGSERGMLFYRLKELEGYFEGAEEQEGFRELKERLAEAVKEEIPVRIE